MPDLHKSVRNPKHHITGRDESLHQKKNKGTRKKSIVGKKKKRRRPDEVLAGLSPAQREIRREKLRLKRVNPNRGSGRIKPAFKGPPPSKQEVMLFKNLLADLKRKNPGATIRINPRGRFGRFLALEQLTGYYDLHQSKNNPKHHKSGAAKKDKTKNKSIVRTVGKIAVRSGAVIAGVHAADLIVRAVERGNASKSHFQITKALMKLSQVPGNDPVQKFVNKRNRRLIAAASRRTKDPKRLVAFTRALLELGTRGTKIVRGISRLLDNPLLGYVDMELDAPLTLLTMYDLHKSVRNPKHHITGADPDLKKKKGTKKKTNSKKKKRTKKRGRPKLSTEEKLTREIARLKRPVGRPGNKKNKILNAQNVSRAVALAALLTVFKATKSGSQEFQSERIDKLLRHANRFNKISNALERLLTGRERLRR